MPRNSFWISTGGTYGPLDAVTAIGVGMQNALGDPALEIRVVRLVREDPGSDVLEGKPVVDEFGQWRPVDWPGKVRNLAQLQRAWAEEEKDLRPGDFGTGRYGGYRDTQVKATGFFRVEQVDGRWWFVDPEGHLFFAAAVTGIGSGAGESRVKERADYFAALPPPEVAQLGRRSAGGYYSWNLLRRHGAEVQTKWIGLAVRRLEAWGLNTVGNWSDVRLVDAGRKAYQMNLGGWGTSWFQWVDQPSTGRMDGENYNIGLVDVTDQPYPELIDALRTTHRRLHAVHAGTTPPFATKPQAR